ncbi:hypothetical protein ACLOJK_024552 [Asimina triloba]
MPKSHLVSFEIWSKKGRAHSSNLKLDFHSSESDFQVTASVISIVTKSARDGPPPTAPRAAARMLLCAFTTPSSSHANRIGAPPIFHPRNPSRSFDTGFSLARPSGRPNASSSPSPLRQTSSTNGDGGSSPHEQGLVSSAAALAAAIRHAATSPVEIVQRVARDGKDGIVLPSADFRRLCDEQLDLFLGIVDPAAVLSVYVRPAGSYVMDQLELRRVSCHPGMGLAETEDIVILIGNFCIPTGLRAAEAALSNNEVQVIPECRAVVLPMLKHPFVVGFLVAELPFLEFETNSQNDGQGMPMVPSPNESYGAQSRYSKSSWKIQSFKDDLMKSYHQFTVEQQLRASKIARSLAMAYVMDQVLADQNKLSLRQHFHYEANHWVAPPPRLLLAFSQFGLRTHHMGQTRFFQVLIDIKVWFGGYLLNCETLLLLKAMLLQQSSWQNNVRMSSLVEQIHGSLSSIRTLTKMLPIHVQRSEISYDIIEDILVQGDRMRDTLQQLQDAANIMRFNEETLKKLHDTTFSHLESMSSREIQDKNVKEMDSLLSLGSGTIDIQMPMPPLTLAATKQFDGRPCKVSDVLAELVEAAGPLAQKQKRSLKFSDFSELEQVAVEESALRQALSNLIEGALLRTHVDGNVEILSTGAPAGALVVIDDDGPDMYYMTQMHSLTPFGVDLFTSGMVEDSMTWNFIAGLTVAREILESYGCFVRVISPRSPNAALGAGGTRIELWLPVFTTKPTEQTPEG